MCQFKQNQIILLRERVCAWIECGDFCECLRRKMGECFEREFRCFVPFFRQKKENCECLCKIVLGEIQISELVKKKWRKQKHVNRKW